MWPEIFLSMALYIVPLTVLPFVIRRQPAARGVAVLALFVAPLAGAATYLIKTQRFSPRELVAIYPFALFPLGFWAALLGALTTPALNYLKAYGSVALIVTAMISGGIIGSVFMWGFAHLGTAIQPPSHPIDGSLSVLCWLSAGSLVGLLAAWRVANPGGRAAPAT